MVRKALLRRKSFGQLGGNWRKKSWTNTRGFFFFLSSSRGLFHLEPLSFILQNWSIDKCFNLSNLLFEFYWRKHYSELNPGYLGILWSDRSYLTLSLPAYHWRQWKSWRIYACLVAKGLKILWSDHGYLGIVWSDRGFPGILWLSITVNEGFCDLTDPSLWPSGIGSCLGRNRLWVSIPGSVGYISHVHWAYDYLGSFGVLWVHMAWHKKKLC